jgi:hypothetical protein
MHHSVQAHMEYFHAPREFEQKLRAPLYPSGPHQQKAIRREWFPRWRAWAAAASGVAVLSFTAVLRTVTVPSPHVLVGNLHF